MTLGGCFSNYCNSSAPILPIQHLV